ncbi:sensor histidine kinase [Micromonospora sp. CA-240977]|uniref:sensor histidine kinase n=1 Tax=Micromonospora sp. CA-240977 TaxID=3239957 RepID=UPI003D8BDC21
MSTLTRGWHPSIRLRLTLTYAVMLVVACAALLALNYAMLYRSLYTELGPPASNSAAPQVESRTAPGLPTDKQTQERVEEVKSQALAELRASTLLDTATRSAVALAVIAVLGLGASWLVAGRMLRPLQTLTATTRRISQDRLHERIALSGPHDELKELADTFDDMVARLENSFASQRRFTADAAHELRTPLAIVRTGIEVLRAKRHSTIEQWEAMADDTLTATGRAERLLDGLLALARSDRGALVHEAHDLAATAAIALGEADHAAEAADVKITTDLRSTVVHGDPVLLDRLLRNLVDNAIRHNHPGGWIEVTIRQRPDGALVIVRNSGDPIPPDEVDRLFEPFQRLDPNRVTSAGSSGLGLAIVRSIVHAHRGTVVATPEPAGGLTVTVALPVTRS